MNRTNGLCWVSTLSTRFGNAAALLTICLAALAGCGAEKGCPKCTFWSSAAPTLQVSTQAIIPTVLQTAISFNSSINGNSGIANVTAGPNGVTNNGVFTLANPTPGATLVGALATLSSSIQLVSGLPALSMTATSLGSSVGLASADFGVWAITNALAAPLPTNSVITYSTFAGGTLLTPSMPTTGTVTYTGKMAGVLADTPVGGSDDVAGTVTLNINFAAGTISGTLSGILTTAGTSTVSPYVTYAPIQVPALTVPVTNITLSTGTITGNSFSATVTTPTIVAPTITSMKGNFYGLTANEVAGTFTISVPSLGTPGPGLSLIGSFGAK